MDALIACLPLWIAWILDLILGDPIYLPHPVVGFGKMIAFCERHLNHGKCLMLKGTICAVALITLIYIVAKCIIVYTTNIYANIAIQSILIYYCLSGTTLIREVRNVFKALDQGLDYGRAQVSRIVGRDTRNLSDAEVKTATLETLSENLSDGVVAPLFWYAILGVPGMIAYKMINTLDSMIGYHNARYEKFGCAAARIDDLANYIPARITAFLMVIAYGRLSLFKFVRKYARKHLSPNSGYPEAALAGILDCRFGGPHDYFGATVYKPYIGYNNRVLSYDDMLLAIHINRRVECMCVAIISLCIYAQHLAI